MSPNTYKLLSLTPVEVLKKGLTKLRSWRYPRTPVYDIDQLQAMRLADGCMERGGYDNDQKSRKVNILPDTNSPTSLSLIRPSFPISSLIHATESSNPNHSVAQAKNAVHDALDDRRLPGRSNARTEWKWQGF
ncbi:hypothetical protein BS17DRAFT_269077 [Gyrodon lividus]|nr:hypothetical protein BS17DRAFT_269077 [Gyrodon lividus]